jgi:Ca-activated chloride channel family protein
MIRLMHPALLMIGVLFLLPYLLRPRRAWKYSSLQLLPAGKQMGIEFLLTAGMTIGALVLLLIALARPQKILAQVQRGLDARDIVLTLDLSLSMEGYIPTDAGAQQPRKKLDVVQQAALAFVKRHQRDRLGLIVFGDQAFGAWPLSTDTTTLLQRLQRLDSLLPAELRGTHVENALLKSLDHMQELGQAQTKMVVMLTDGLDTIGAEAEERLLRRLRTQDTKLYVLGLQLPDDSSIVHLTRRAQGRYYDVNRAEELEQALQDVERLERSRITMSHNTAYRELFQLFAFPGLILLLGSTICKSVWVLEM